jgi:Family of unknown function (DUF6600)
VMRGAATLTTERGSMPLRAGERSVALEDRTPSAPQRFNAARFDDFDRWYADRRAARVNPPSTPSGQYLPAELRAYSGTLDRNGSWQYSAPYGYVWYPSVAADWQPYYDGYWESVPSYGWTWIGVGAWAWPTHHYGRWGYGRGSWFWIPGRTWGSAWVSWASAPGYMSWCPLGFDGRPVFGLSVGLGGSRSGWVVVPRTSFGGRSFYASRHSIPIQRLSRSTPFAVQSHAPAPAPRVAARANRTGAPSTGVAVPRFPSRPADSPGSVNGRRTGPNDSRGAVSRDQNGVATGPNGNAAGAGSARDFRRPVPGEVLRPDKDGPAPADPGSPRRAVPRTPDAERPQHSNVAPPAARPPDSDGARPRYRRPEPPDAQAGTPAPHAVPRSTPPREERQPPQPPSAPAAQPARPQDAPPSGASSPPRSSQSPPPAQRPSPGSGGEAARTPHGDRPASSGGSDSRAVPRGEGSHQGRQR